MAERYTSLVGLLLEKPVADVGALVDDARRARDIDRASPVTSEGTKAQEVHWGGRMQRAVVRQVDDDGQPMLRTEAHIGSDGVRNGIQRQAQLLQGLARHVEGAVSAVRDVSARVDRDEAWMHRAAVGAVEQHEVIATMRDGEGTWWVHTHGAARFDVPDLELYGLTRHQVDAAVATIAHVHQQLLDGGLRAQLTLADETPVYLVPVLEAWQHLPFEWPGVGRAGQDRGPGLDGPRATLSVLHPPRLGRYKRDFDGVLATL